MWAIKHRAEVGPSRTWYTAGVVCRGTASTMFGAACHAVYVRRYVRVCRTHLSLGCCFRPFGWVLCFFFVVSVSSGLVSPRRACFWRLYVSVGGRFTLYFLARAIVSVLPVAWERQLCKPCASHVISSAQTDPRDQRMHRMGGVSNRGTRVSRPRLS